MSLFSPFRDRQADIVAYKGNVCKKKGSPMVNWIMGRLQNIKETDRQTLWLIGYIQSKGRTSNGFFWIIRRLYANSRFLTEEMRNL